VPELAAWAALCDVGRKKRETSAALATEAKMREGLVMDLLGVYMRDGWVIVPGYHPFWAFSERGVIAQH
jgi:hypothetical protein